jgi:hypothetical protein
MLNVFKLNAVMLIVMAPFSGLVSAFTCVLWGSRVLAFLGAQKSSGRNILAYFIAAAMMKDKVLLH